MAISQHQNLHYVFVSSQGFLKATQCNSVDGFGCTHLSHSTTSNFKGVDRKQNMYYEKGGSCRQWIIGFQLEKKRNSQNATYWEAVLGSCFALLSSIDGLAGRSGGGIWKATFLTVTHWPECMIRLRVNKARNGDHSQLWLSQSGYHGNWTKWWYKALFNSLTDFCDLMLI